MLWSEFQSNHLELDYEGKTGLETLYKMQREIKNLIKKYKNREENSVCPFCWHPTCRTCTWVYITGRACGPSMSSIMMNEESVKLRIKELQMEWLPYINQKIKELEGGD